MLITSQKGEMVKLNRTPPFGLSYLVHSEKSLPRFHKAGLYYFCMIVFLMYLLFNKQKGFLPKQLSHLKYKIKYIASDV